MKRTGQVHHYESFAYLLVTACRVWHRGDELTTHFSTHWDNVTCRSCLERRPVPKKAEKALSKLESFNKENSR